MCECHSPKHVAMKFLVLGLVLILVPMYTDWNIWVVLGALLIVKALMLFVMPSSKCCTEEKLKKKKK